MGRPKGSGKKKEVVAPVKAEVEAKVEIAAPEVQKQTEKPVEKPVEPTPVRVSKCRPPHIEKICQCQDPLADGQAYFEDGPTGTIKIGDASRDDMVLRLGVNSQGQEMSRKINKKR